MKGNKAVRLIFILCLTIVLYRLTPAQETSHSQNPDTSLAGTHVFHLPPLFYTLSFDPSEQNVSPSFPMSGSLYQQLGLRDQNNFWEYQEGIDLDSPWKVHLETQREHSTFYSIMGSVSLGGTAYILYRHIKKYGLK